MRLSLLLVVVVSACTRDPVPRAETPPPEYEPPAAASPPPTAPAPLPEPEAPDAASDAPALERGADVSCAAPPTAPATKLLGYPQKALADLSRDRVGTSGFDTEGFVVRHFVPVPCPPKALCKPQPPPYLVLGDRATGATADILLETPKPKSFPIGKRYAVSIVVCGTQSYGGTTNEGHLLAAVPK